MYTLGIETFLVVVRTQSLSKASEELHLAQTTVSQRLKVLEQEIGITLIERSKGIKQIRLTPSGEEFFKLAEQWSFIWREAKLLQAHGPKLSLVVGSVDTINTFVLPQVYRALIKHYPPIKMEIRTSHSIELYAEVEKRQIDVAFVLRELVHPNVHVTKSFSSPMVVLRVGTTAEQTSKTITPSELNHGHELFMPWGQGFQSWHEHWWDPLSPSQIKLDSAHLLLSLLQHPEQWAIVPMWIANAALKRGGYHVYNLTDPPPNYTCYKLTHKHPTSLLSQSLDILDQYFQSLVPSLIR
ncbi:MAG: transcriptional regulator, LysR family [Firmicutes bacterium]|nr:transcriptional regulator, LysR family [Bacillota bacterium]